MIAILHDKGLTAFDKNNIGRSRKYAVKICIEVTLQLLTKSLSDKMKSLLLWTGIGTSIEIDVLHCLWNVSEQEATNTVDILWTYGLLQFTDITIPQMNTLQCCVEIHAVISQYIIKNMESREMSRLSPFLELNTSELVDKKSTELAVKNYFFHASSSLFYDINYLKHFGHIIENYKLPYCIKKISMMTITDPHRVILYLHDIPDS